MPRSRRITPGEANAIADLLQALDSRKDLEVSFAALERLLTGVPQPSDVQAALDARLARAGTGG